MYGLEHTHTPRFVRSMSKGKTSCYDLTALALLADFFDQVIYQLHELVLATSFDD